MEGERTPNIPSPAKDQMAYIDFMVDIKAKKKWMIEAAEVIARNEALLATIGKGDQIEQLYAEAAALKASVLSAVEEREAQLAADRRAFDEIVEKRNASFAEKKEKDAERFAMKTRRLDTEIATATTQAAAAKAANMTAQADATRTTSIRRQVTSLRDELKDQAERGRKLLNPKAA